MISQTYSSYIGNYLKYLVSQARKNNLTGEEILSRAEVCEIDGALFGAIAANYITAEDLQIDDKKLQLLLQQYRINQMAKISFWFNSLKKVLNTINDIPCILLKGMPLSQIFHGELFWRNSNDIDLWVPENQYHKATSLLEEIGYQCDIQPHEWATNQIHLKHKIMPSVEIHWKISPPPWRTPSFEHAYKRAIKYHNHDVDVYILSEADMWINLLIHAQQHFFAPKTVLDLCGCLEKIKPDLSLLDAYGLERMYFLVQKSLTSTSDIESGINCKDHCMINLPEKIVSKMFIDPRMGRLSLGDDSQLEAMIGVFLRALSMMVLDGNMYKFRSAVTVLFYGPHRLGAFLNRFI